MLKLKLQYFGHLMQRVDSLEKTLMLGGIGGRRRRGRQRMRWLDASRTRWTWVWVNSRSWWWMGRPGVLRFMELQRVGHDWVTELNWLVLNVIKLCYIYKCKTVILFWWASISPFDFCIYLPWDLLRFSSLWVCVFLISSGTYSEVFLSNIFISNFLFLLLALRVCYHFCSAFKKSQG